jgi:ankyrin repeat protein
LRYPFLKRINERPIYFEIVQFLIKSKININQRNGKGETALINAIKDDHEEVISLLLESKVDVNLGKHQVIIFLKQNLFDGNQIKKKNFFNKAG